MTTAPAMRVCAGATAAFENHVRTIRSSSSLRARPNRRPPLTNSPFLPAQTAAMLQQMLPVWAKRAACAGKAPNQAPWAPMFRDEVAAHKDDSYSWPAETIRAMQTCAGCPVRTECLAYGFKGTPTTGRHFGVYGGVPGRIRESRATDPCPTCNGSGFLDEVLGIPF